MATRVERRTVDLSSYPDLVVIYLGMRVNRLTGIKTLLGFGPKISSSAAAQPEGLLRHENVIYSLLPMHVGMRQYWRDPDSLLNWTRSDPHRQWWPRLFEGFWRYWLLARNLFPPRRHGSDLRRPAKAHRLYEFAPVVPARGPMFGAAARSGNAFAAQPVLSEKELYEERQR